MVGIVRFLSCILVLAACVTGGASADVLTLRSGEIIHGELVYETPDEVVFHGKIAGIWSKARFDRARVASVKREPGDQGPSSQRKPAEPPVAPASPKAPADDPAPPRPAQPAPVPADDAVTEVKVRGSGATPKDAFDDAVRTALIQVAGAFIRADTTLEDELLVQDRIIAHSQGFIERATKVGEARLEGGVYRQDAIVVVRRGKVAKVLVEPASTDGSVDGQTLAARIRSMQDQSASAQELMKAVFEGWPANVVSLVLSQAPTAAKVPKWREQEIVLRADEIYLEAKFDATVDRAKWTQWRRGAIEALAAVSEVRATVEWSLARSEAIRVPNDEIPGILQSLFLDHIPPILSDRAAEGRHLFVQSALRRLYEMAQGSVGKVRPGARPGSLKREASLEDSHVLIALCAADGGPTEVFLVERTAFATVPADLTSAPVVVSGLFETSTEKPLGRTVPILLKAESGPQRVAVAVSEEILQHYGVSVSPATLVRNYSDGKPDMIVLVPWFSSGDLRSNPAEFLSEVVSLPIGLCVPRSDLARMGVVRTSLGERRAVPYLLDGLRVR